MTPIYTRRACTSICIFKNTLPFFLVCSLCVCLHVCMWSQCVGGNNSSSFVCHSMCVTCITHILSEKQDWDCETGMSCSDIADFVSDYCMTTEILANKCSGQNITGMRGSGSNLYSPLRFIPSKYLITTLL